MNENCLDNILAETGEFGKYQRRITALLMIFVITTYFSVFVWLFEAKQINHRCEIMGCESNSEFKPPWWSNAIPAKGDGPASCFKYRRISNVSENSCNATDFDHEVRETCDKYVYETKERSIVQDFDLHCEDNLWRLTFVGTINSIGTFVGLPLSGILSDKYGRKTVLLGTVLFTGIAGLTRSFSQSYTFFLIMEFFDAMFSSGSYAAGFILALELVGPKQRVLINALIGGFYAFGGITVGVLAWLLQSWRPLVQILYGFLLLFMSYYWLVPESVRWLLTQKRYSEAVDILHNIAKTNGKTIPEEKIKELCREDAVQKSYKITDLFKSVSLTLRFINCSICWIISIFVYQGLTIFSVDLSGNSYLDYILTILVELPGSYISYILMDSLGRRLTLAGSLFVCSLSCVCLIFIPSNIYWLTLTVYLIGKLGSTVHTVVIYAVTSEVFPTSLRNSLLSGCSMFGRIGAIISPQVILLVAIWKPLALILFAITSLLAGVLGLLFPETKNTKLPDTFLEAKHIGKPTRELPTSIPLMEQEKDITEFSDT